MRVSGAVGDDALRMATSCGERTTEAGETVTKPSPPPRAAAVTSAPIAMGEVRSYAAYASGQLW